MINSDSRRLGKYEKILFDHASLALRRINSLSQISTVNKAIEKKVKKQPPESICIYCTGSLGRLDYGKKSDLDLFVIADNGHDGIKRIKEIEIFACLISVNKLLKLPEFSNDGQFLRVYKLKELLAAIGSPKDDAENLFTARMLLLLESKCVWGEQKYETCLQAVADHYFRDSKGKQSFRPLFLLNDLLRFWRTLCLNYEEIRNNSERAWRKKNINLKFSRMLTVYATVLPIVSGLVSSKEDLVKISRLPPLERLALALEKIDDDRLLSDFSIFLNDYEDFLTWKEFPDTESYLATDPDHKKERGKKAERFSGFLYKIATHEKIKEEYRKYLVI